MAKRLWCAIALLSVLTGCSGDPVVAHWHAFSAGDRVYLPIDKPSPACLTPQDLGGYYSERYQPDEVELRDAYLKDHHCTMVSGITGIVMSMSGFSLLNIRLEGSEKQIWIPDTYVVESKYDG